MKIAAGIALINNGKILLVHPTNAKWDGTYSIPKGGVNKGENIRQAAQREFFEETGLRIPIELLAKPNELIYINGKKVLHYFIVRDYPVDINKINLQEEEVDWCGFLTKQEALKKINRNMLSIITHI